MKNETESDMTEEKLVYDRKLEEKKKKAACDWNIK